MKKTLLSLLVLAGMTATAQVEVFAENFNTTTALENWTLVDADGDNNNWIQVTFGPGPLEGIGVMRSFSWIQSGALTPNNYAFTPPIDLSNYSGATLSWKHMAADAAWDAEKYNVYITTAPNAESATPATLIHEQSTMDNINSLTTVTVDISAYAGQTIYIGFRHFDSTDQFSIEIDDLLVEAQTFSSDDFFSKNLSLYPNPTSDFVNLTSSNALINSIKITDLNGRTVRSLNLSSVNATQINVSDLMSGVYIISVETAEGTGTSRFVKK
jgi:hypothetical protein